MKPTFIVGFICLMLSASAQVIPASRQANWSDALGCYDYAVPVTELNVMDFGATGNGTTNDQPAVVSAIAALNGAPGYIYFPPGTYKMTEGISLPDSVVLKGHSSDSTTLLFNLGAQPLNCISIAGTFDPVHAQLNSGYMKGNYWVRTDSAFLFAPAEYAEIWQNNGAWDEVPADWAVNSVGQIVQVDHVNGDTIFLESPLRITYEAQLDPRIRRIMPKVNAGIECLKIKRQDQATSGSNIMLSYAAHCFIRGVESDVSVSAHVDIFTSTRILIDGSYFHHAFEYDGIAKRGYGVTLNAHSGECLITDNIFRYLRHAMMVKTGANGNIFSYNYSREVNRSEWPYNYGGDISLHGHYPFANLFEGNIVQNIIIDHYWGPSGPYNTFFRNRAETYGIIFTAGNPTTSNYQHIVGNDVDYNGISFIGGPYSITGTNHIQHGNNIEGTIRPPGTNTLADTSYYLAEEPVFWDISDGWPSLGIPNPLMAGSNPARTRWFSSGTKTVCPLKKTWNGSASTDWSDPHNWSPYGVPGAAAAVTIPSSVPQNPVLSNGMVNSIRSMKIHAGREVQLSNGSTLVIIK